MNPAKIPLWERASVPRMQHTAAGPELIDSWPLFMIFRHDMFDYASPEWLTVKADGLTLRAVNGWAGYVFEDFHFEWNEGQRFGVILCRLEGIPRFQEEPLKKQSKIVDGGY